MDGTEGSGPMGGGEGDLETTGEGLKGAERGNRAPAAKRRRVPRLERKGLGTDTRGWTEVLDE